MRIRRRLPLSLPPLTSSSITTPQAQTLSRLSDPALLLNGWCRGKPGANEDAKLHLAEDSKVNQLKLVLGANMASDSQNLRTSCGSSNYMSNSTTSHVQAVKSEVKEEDGERILESSRRSGSAHGVQVNSKKRITSNAIASGATEARLDETGSPQPRRRRGGCNSVTNKTSLKERAKTTTKTSGNASLDDGYSENENRSSDVAVKDDASNNVKKRRTPAVVMEGSRCSRVNGRGWRCCQQTLVGYSLCEHHLGKGRLRSMSSVRGQLGTSKPNAEIEISSEKPSSPISLSVVALEERIQNQSIGAGNNGRDELKEEMITKKRKKSGTMKARSVTGLLNESRDVEATEMPKPENVALLLLGTRSDVTTMV